MNLYSNINSFSNFSGWGSSSGSILDSSGWVPVSTPKVSDYVPSYTSAAPSAADYIRTQPVTEPSVTRPASLEPAPVTETSLSGSRHYSVEELQQIGSGSKEEVVEFFKNIGGDVKTVIDEDGISSQNYSSPLLDGKEFIVTERGKSYWQTGHGALFENGKMIREALSSASPTVSLTDSEIAAIINAQNNLPPQAEDYIPVETAPAAEGGNTELPANPLTETAAVLRPDIVPAVPQPPAAVPAENTAAETPPAAPSETAVPARTEGGNAAATESSAASPSADAVSAQENVAAENTASAADSAQTQNPHPQNQAADAVGTATTLAQSALGNPHQEFMAEAERLKNMASQKHDLASGFSQTIMEFEEGRIYDERRAYYTNNREALNEAVEKIRTDAAELAQKHGEAAGKTHFIGGVMKILGGVGNGINAYELGSRINIAWKDGNWDPVAGQVAKIAASAAAMNTGMTIARGLGLLIAGTTGGAAIVTLGVGLLATYLIMEGANALDNYISESGNLNYVKDIKLEAEKNITLIGNHQFKNLEINSDETLTIIGKVNAEENLVINSPHIEITDGSEISADFMRESEAENTDTAAVEDSAAEAGIVEPEIIPEPAQSQQTDESELYVDYGYLRAAAAEAGLSSQDYLKSFLPIDEETVPKWEHWAMIADSFLERMQSEQAEFFSAGTLEESVQPVSEYQLSYPDISPSVILSNYQENLPI